MLLMVWWQPAWIIALLAPGFKASQMGAAIPLTRILFPFIMCVSSAALIAGALHSVNHFTVTAFGPVLLNMVYLAGLLVCIFGRFSPLVLAWFILGGGVAHLVMHWWVFRSYGLHFSGISRDVVPLVREVLGKFGPALLGMSVVELNMVIDGRFASYLQTGSVTMLHYGNRFMGIPLGVFGVAFATVLLAHFSRTSLYARSRFGYYLLEAAKLITWLMIPAMLVMWHIAHPIFASFLVGKASSVDIVVAAQVLRVYGSGLVFFCLNKVLMNMAYSLGDMRLPVVASLTATGCNIIGNSIAVHSASRVGIALATVLSTGVLVSVIMIGLLWQRHHVRIYGMRFLQGAPGTLVHGLMVFACYSALERVACLNLVPFLSVYLPAHAAYWFIAIPLISCAALVLYLTRHWVGLKLYFAP